MWKNRNIRYLFNYHNFLTIFLHIVINIWIKKTKNLIILQISKSEFVLVRDKNQISLVLSFILKRPTKITFNFNTRYYQYRVGTS